MNKNKISIIINKPIEDVFEFTTNPNNTPLWITHLKKEIAEPYPPVIGTVYKNTTDGDNWDVYEVIEFEEGTLFTLKDTISPYKVRYTYKSLDQDKTNLEYFEWMEQGELSNPFKVDVLEKLKNIMDK